MTSNPTPKRGGVHPIYGAFVGGGQMDSTYNLINPDFQCISQLRTIKQLQNIQNSLEQARDNIAGVKFHGNIEIDDSKSATELDKKNFVERVELLVNTHGFQTFFYMKGPDGKMYSLLSHSHLFTLDAVLQEHRRRALPHVPAYDSSGNETPESLQLSYSKYDPYEKLDCSLSRLAIQSIIGKVLQDDIKTRYSHLPDFLNLPGSVYFLMALEASNASVALDIDDVIDKFNNLSLASYPGENIKSLATEALRLIKIMEGGYCLPLKLGSDLLKKVYSTSCEHFNRWIHAKLDEVRELELTYKLKDPKLMMNDPKYGTLGPIALCGFLQEKYGSLVTEKAWPALSSSVPSSNLAPIVSAEKDEQGRQCFHCQSPDHLRNRCPKLGRDGTGGGKACRGEKVQGEQGGTDPPTPSTGRSPFPAWRYIEPVDKTSAVVVGDVTYKWCSKCRCRATGKQGYFTTNHFTLEYIDKQVSFNGSEVAANHSAIAPLVPLADDSFLDDSVPDEEQLVFSGAWNCSLSTDEPPAAAVINCTIDHSLPGNPSMWMASIHPVEEEEEQSEPEDCEALEVGPEECEALEVATTVIDVDVLANTSGGMVVAIPVPCPPSSASSLLVFDTPYNRVYSTDPPLSVFDLDVTESYPCDTSTCAYFGPGGFNCPHCPMGIFHTALVVCHHCANGHGYLGDTCELCGESLWGTHLLPVGLPNQNLGDYVEEDPASLQFFSRNTSRTSHYTDGHQFIPFPSANWVSKHESLESLPSLHLPSERNKQHEKQLPRIQMVDTVPSIVDDAELEFFEADSATPSSTIEDSDDDEVVNTSHFVDVSEVQDVTLGTKSVDCIRTLLFIGISSLCCCLREVVILLWCRISQAQSKACFIAFLIGTFMWDVIDVFRTPVGTVAGLRATKRVKRLRKGTFFPRHWMLLSSLMLLGRFKSWSPFYTSCLPISLTYQRCLRLSSLVQMSPQVVWDLHTYRWRELFPLNRKDNDDHYSSKAVREEKQEAPDMDSGQDVFYDAVESFQSFDFLQMHPLFPSTVFIDCTEKHAEFGLPSRPGLNAALTGINFLDCLAPSHLNRFPVIFDSGASIAITGNKGDFVDVLHPPARELRLGGMARGAKVEGIGTVNWHFQTSTCSITLALTCYYVPDCQARLLSPQRLLNAQRGVTGSFTIKEEHAILELNNHPPLIIEYDTNSNLPVGLSTNGRQSGSVLQANLCVTDDENQNLTPAQKLLLMWHFRFGHRNLPHVQSLLRLPIFAGEKYKAASRASLPKCAVCEYAKAHAKPTSGNSQSVNLLTDGAVKDGALRAGAKVSADHFESRLKGRTYTSYGRTTSDQFVGGCIFVDHMSGYIHVEHQLGFSSSETIRAKQNFEQLALGHGVLVEEYLTDNGVFSKTQFLEHIRQHNQQVHFCGVNAHHKNAVAERAIRTVSELARSLLLHASIHWPEGVDGSLWPMAVDYATHLYNTLPNHHGVCPGDLFTAGTTIPRHKLKDLHVWGCPVYVLDPTLQQGMKLPRWQPRSRRGLFVGYSRHHSSDVPLVLNLQTGSISPQFHVVFDDSFSTVKSIRADEIPPDFWNAPNLEMCIHRVPVDASDPAASLLPDDWLTPHELEEKRRRLNRQTQIRDTYIQPVSAPLPISTAIAPASAVPSDIATMPSAASTHVPSPASVSGVTDNDAAPGPSDPTPTTVVSPTTVVPALVPVSASSSAVTTSSPASLPLRRSSRSTKGSFHSTKYIDEVYLSSILEVPRSQYETELAYHAELHTDLDTGDLNYFDPHAFVAQVKKHDPDNPSYSEAMSGDDAHHYIEAMKQEINALLQQRTWTRVPRKDVPKNADGSERKILKGTWAFKLKRLPDGTPLKYKARYCCRGDMQTAGVDYFDTYAPVVQWSTIRLVLTLVLKHGWSTRQVDYTNAFAQAHLQEEVYIEPPRGFTGVDGVDKVLKLLKSLYGLKQAPKTFFEKLRAGLLERGFTPSNIDPCLFMKDKMICVVYVDDTILCGPDCEALEAEIKGLGVNTLEQRHTFQLRNEGEVGDFLGIRIEKQDDANFYLTQTGLIEKILTITDMIDCNPVSTPTGKEALGSDPEGTAFKEKWKYSTVIGMLLYLSGNTRPDITFAVHQCARHSHHPKQSHAIAVKRIVRYLKGTKDKGMIFSPTGDFGVNCFVDADFAGLWGVEYDQDPVSVKSRTGYLIMFMDCPLLWVSKLQTQIALSTMEAEYIALSSAMRELIAIREILKELKQLVFHASSKPSYSMVAKTFEPIPPSHVFEDNESCLKFATLPRMSPRTKHIAIPYHFFRTKVNELEIQVLPVDTNDQLADQFTKGLREEDFVRSRKRILGW